MKALLLALSCLVLFAVACGGDDFDSTAGSSSGGGSALNAPTGPDAAPPQQGASAPTTSALGLPDKLIVTTNLELQVAALRDAYVQISGYARAYGGFVAEAKLSDDSADGSAFMRLRVPAERHDEMVAQVREFPDAELQREDSTAREVTAEYTDLQSRLANMREAEAQYQALLDRAGTIEDVLQVTAKIDAVRGDIESLEGRIKLIEDQADFASVTVRLWQAPPVAVEEKGAAGLASPLEMLEDATAVSLTVAQVMLNVLIVIGVAAAWLVPALFIALLARRYLRGPVGAMKTWFQ